MYQLLKLATKSDFSFLVIFHSFINWKIYFQAILNTLEKFLEEMKEFIKIMKSSLFLRDKKIKEDISIKKLSLS